MRISQSLLNNLVSQRTSRAQERYVEVATRLTSESAVTKPSDDPVRASRIQQVDKYQRRLETLDRNRQLVRGDLTAMEEILAGVHDIVADAQILAVSMSNAVMNEDNRAVAGEQVSVMLEQSIGLINRRLSGGRYLFAGLNENSAAYADDGSYNGGDANRMVEIGPGFKMEGTMLGSEAFGANQEVFTALRDLATALKANDLDGVQASLDTMEAARETVSMARSEIGTRLDTVSDVDNLVLDLSTGLEVERAGLDGVDLARGATDLATARTALDAVLSTSRQLIEQGTGSWLR